ncbi:MAG: hypothetical protein KAT32_03570 [Candidatus Moranbacteria bacterium]|nr:hypothetical protein [Candidatus Moranbacteria bacterium]
MLNFIISQIYFILIIIFLLFLPGYLILCGVFKREHFSAIERLVLAVPISFTLITLLIIISGTLGMPINKMFLWILFGVVNIILLALTFFRKRKDKTKTENKLFNFSKNQTRLIIILIALTVIIKSFYLINAIFPTSTDLAHHMFWVEKIVATEQLPEYQESLIEFTNENVPYLTEPEKIADFIVGEHLIFVAVSLLSNQKEITAPLPSTVSSFPSLILLIINLTSILTVFILTQRLFEKYKHVAWVSIFVLLFLGPLYAISSSQAKFVSGGAIGNILGDLFIPTIFYFIYRAFAHKRPAMLMLTVLFGAGLAYTHHLSAFIFGYAFGFSLLILCLLQIDFKQLLSDLFKLRSVMILTILFTTQIILNYFLEKYSIKIPVLKIEELKISLIIILSFLGNIFILSILQKEFKETIFDWFRTTIKHYVFALVVLVVCMFTFFYVPSYLNKDAIGSATGAPTKSTRVGISLTELMYKSGEARFTLGIIGLAIIILITLLTRHPKTREYFNRISPANQYGQAIIIGWTVALIAMSLAPQYLKVNIISSRIANYIIFPITILSGFAVVWIFDILHQRRTDKTYLPKILVSATFTLVFLFVLTNGMRDNSSSLKELPNVQDAMQTYHASERLAKILKDEDLMVKDHNYIVADSWIKIFFARDYNMPLSRAYFKRYETNPYRETCTLKMISQPSTPEAEQCFENLNVSTVMVHTNHDASQFNNSSDFSRIYQNDELSVYFRKEK